MSDDPATPRSYFIVPHTHWDREWYRPFEHFRLELARVVDEVLDVLERDPGFTSFTLDGQAIVLEDYVDVRPENEGRLRALLEAGRIEVGPSYMLPDEFLVGGESLVRNLLMGREVCRRFGAQPSPVGYLPDSFGHPLQMPQILAGFGIRSFIFSRGMGDELDEVGVVFRWQAPDGSEVLALQQLHDYSNFAEVWTVERGENRVREIVERFGQALARAGVHEVLLSNGSDHLPVMTELPALCPGLEQRFPGSRFAIARFADYVAAVGEVDVPAWRGELLGSRLNNVLRGVNSSRLYIKQADQHAERRLLSVETLAALRTLSDGRPFPSSDFKLAWRELLRCHPHDTICGCSCDEVHRDALVRYEALHRSLDVLQDRALDGWEIETGEVAGMGVINLLPHRRKGLIEVPGMEPALIELDGFAAGTVELTAAEAGPGAGEGADETTSSIENDLVRVSAASDGTLTVIDRQRGTRFEGMHAFEDEADMGDLYNFCPIAEGAVWRNDTATARVMRSGGVVSELEISFEATLPAELDEEFRPVAETVDLTVRTVVRLVQGSRRVEFLTTIDNSARDHRLRVVFPVGGADEPVLAEGQFAVVKRPFEPTRPRTDWVEPPDPTGHTLGAVAVGPVALLTKGLPEYQARAGAGGVDLCLTLLRCVGVIAQPGGTLTTRPWHAGPATPTPEGQCLGRHEFEYALLLGADDLDDVALLRESLDYRYGFLTLPRPVRLDPPITIDGDVVFSCLKGAEDGNGLILRLFNPSDGPAAVRVAAADGVRAELGRMSLDEAGEQPVSGGELQLNPGEICTLRMS